MFASESLQLNTVNTLIRCGADVNIYDFDGRMAIHYATKSLQCLEIVKYLLQSGQCVNVLSLKGLTLLDYLFPNEVPENHTF